MRGKSQALTLGCHTPSSTMPAPISIVDLDRGATVHESPVSYMAFTAQDCSSGATAILPPPLWLRCFSNASLDGSLGIWYCSSSDDQYALPRWDLARWEVSRSPLCPSVCKKKQEKKSHSHILDTPYPVPSHFELY
ncbi:uncharacterized protein TrAFT101_006240 [Trichoderma asperellum]|uniref:uncharacterized protein n=1 Tax=Trichoderma asperellum TaxID=101201 RepID=UPI00332AA401|nr:hypothetical protein TrAFT101_006240 [Trichoderma asperellum]